MNTITTCTFEKILDTFAADGILFSNERQFQLELAWKLKEAGYKVYLEMLDTSSDDKKYIDIAIDIGDQQFVVVELKYTTRQKDMQYKIADKIIPTFAQGAGDIRRYDYLKDVQRIETLLSKQETDLFGIPKARVKKGYAIIMTNDKYWEKDGIHNGKETCYFHVALNHGRKIPAKENLTFKIGDEERAPIHLENEYICNWKKYNLPETTCIHYMTPSGQKKDDVSYSNYEFQYMILEVK